MNIGSNDKVLHCIRDKACEHTINCKDCGQRVPLQYAKNGCYCLNCDITNYCKSQKADTITSVPRTQNVSMSSQINVFTMTNDRRNITHIAQCKNITEDQLVRGKGKQIRPCQICKAKEYFPVYYPRHKTYKSVCSSCVTYNCDNIKALPHSFWKKNEEYECQKCGEILDKAIYSAEHARYKQICIYCANPQLKK